VRDFEPFDFRTPAERARSSAALVSLLRGERQMSTSPGLPAAPPMPPRDSGWLDHATFSLSDPNERQLLYLLVQAYPRHDAIRRIMEQVGIQQELIDWKSMPLQYIWHSVLVHAARQQGTRALVQHALADPAAADYHSAIRRVIGEAPG
jgi:hypothetical protein